MNLSYELIDENNIKLASSIQGTIFPGESASQHYKHSIISNHKNSSYYIISWNNIPVGITGIYIMNKYDKQAINDNSVWLGWFGVLPEFRSKGIGRQALLDTIEKSKIYKRKYFRIYTVSTDKALAQLLYKSIMQTRENYQNKHDYNYNGNCYIYSYNLQNDGNIDLWNDKYAYINEDLEMESKANKELDKFYKILINISLTSKEFNKTLSLATSFREDGNLVIIDTTLKNINDYDIIIDEEQISKFINERKTISTIKKYYYNRLKEKNNG